MTGLLSLANMRLAAQLAAKHNGQFTADLTSVPDPTGRLDFLASQLIAQGAAQLLSPEAQMTYHAARPLIDGWLSRNLTERVSVPPEVVEFVKAQLLKGIAA